ncbi:MAG: hypothetical protein WDO74_26830 [Pseudomonadota bacterium]
MLAFLAAQYSLKRMPHPIPPGSETMVLPRVGKVVVFREGPTWLAVRPDVEDAENVPTGIGATMGEAVAELVAAEG